MERNKEVIQMKLEVKTNVKGLEELKELLDSAAKQATELQETLDKIFQSEIKIDFELTNAERIES